MFSFFTLLKSDTQRHRDIFQRQLANKNFQTGFVVTGGWFLSYCNHQLIKFEEKKRLQLEKQFYNHDKREINTFKNFPSEISLCHTEQIYT